MEMKKKKIITICGVTTLFALLCTGCGTQAQDNTPGLPHMTIEDVERRTQEPESQKQDEQSINVEDFEYTDTIRWFNASFSVLIGMNLQDYNIYGGVEKTQLRMLAVQQMLENSWGITDHETADEMLDWLMTEGHRLPYARDMEYLKECGIDEFERDEWADFVLACFYLEEDGAEIYARAYEVYSDKGVNAFAAWDYSRAMSTAAYCYIADYYTLDEALDYSLEAAKEAQSAFTSWDDFMESYLLGYECWAEESGELRRDVYEVQKAADDSPYNIDWNLTFEKTW